MRPMFGKDEISIFLTVFVIFSFFSQWIGWMENSNLDLIMAMAEENTLTIDSYYNNTSDRALIDGHYYSNKPPGLAMISVPLYKLADILSSPFDRYFSDGENRWVINNDVIDIYVNTSPDRFTLLMMFLLVAFASSLFSAMTAVILYKTAGFYTKERKCRVAIPLIYAFGTLAFHCGTVFFSSALSTFFIFISFYMILKTRRGKAGDENTTLFFSGLASGLSITTDYSCVFIAFPIFLFLLSFRKEKFHLFLLGGLAGILPLLLYNFMVFGTPFDLTFRYIDPEISPAPPRFDFPNPYIIFRSLIYPYHGILFYHPDVILSFLGMLSMYRKYKEEAIFIIFAALLLLLYASSNIEFFGMTSFSNYRLLPVIPFLMIPAVFALDKNDRRMIIFIVFISVLINLSGFQRTVSFLNDETEMVMSGAFTDDVNSFRILSNPIYDYYFPEFLRNGPRSPLMEELLKSQFPDIRSSQLEDFSSLEYVALMHTPLGFLSVRIPFLAFFLSSSFAIFIWGKELFKEKDDKTIFILTSLLVIFFALFLDFRDEVYGDNWYGGQMIEGRSYMWMSQNGTIWIHNPSNAQTVGSFCFETFSPDSFSLYVFVNGKSSETVMIGEGFSSFCMEPELANGKNEIMFVSENGCRNPADIGKWQDTRCISFAITGSNL